MAFRRCEHCGHWMVGKNGYCYECKRFAHEVRRISEGVAARRPAEAEMRTFEMGTYSR
jgi:hypothetical protein